MNSVINVYKEKCYTSFRAVAAIRSITHEKKVGHLGTLDPDAEGVLPVCLGKATKLMGLLEDGQKEYKTVMQLGILTDTLDISGEILESVVPGKYSDEQIKSVFKQFTGNIEQIPPMYSAVKINGVKAVNAARKGINLELRSRTVTIFGYSDIEYDIENDRISFTVRCSRGTYIRTLCKDIGNKLGIPACLYSLVRTEAAGLRIEDARTLDEIRDAVTNGNESEIMIPLDTMLEDRPAVYSAGPDTDYRLYMGNFLEREEVIPGENVNDRDILPGTDLRIYDSKGEFIALYRYDNKINQFRCSKMLYEIHN